MGSARIVVMGVSGSGKTTVARALAQALKLPTPGSTIRSARATTSGSAVTDRPRAPDASSARAALRRLPEP